MGRHRVLAPKQSNNPSGSEAAMTSLTPKGSITKRRQAVRVACEFCKRKRVKCDGIRPKCQNCIARRAPCNYDAAPDQTRATALKEEVERLRADNTALMEIFWRLQTTATESAQTFLEFVRRSKSLDVRSLTGYFYDERLQDETDEVNGLPDGEPQLPTVEKQESRQTLESLTSAKSSGIYTSPRPGFSVNCITVSAVREAVETFMQSAGGLFRVFTKAEVSDTVNEAFKDCLRPDEANFIKIIGREAGPLRRVQLVEICGMAAVGTLYLRLSRQQCDTPSSESANVLYTITRHLLEVSIAFSPLRAMKICALLAMYNIVLKGTVALAYIELGLSLGRSHGIHSASPPSNVQARDFLEYKRVWNTLLLFSCWLNASLGHTCATAAQETQIQQVDMEKDLADDIQAEIMKVTVIKSRIIRTMAGGVSLHHFPIDKFRRELRELHQAMPSEIAIGRVFDDQRPSPLRANTFYLHLFYLSAMQLLHRRVILHTEESRQSSSAKEAIREGLVAAKMAARVLSLMRLEGTIVQICWLCIFSSYTTAIILLQAAVQKVVTGHSRSACISDLTLVESCIHILHYCAQVDGVASDFEGKLRTYQNVICDAAGYTIGDGSNDNHWETTQEEGSVDYLLETPTGDETLDKAARDLLRLSQMPFTDALELTSSEQATTPQRRALVNWAEAALGSSNEWVAELQHGVCTRVAETVSTEACNDDIIGILSTFRPGQFVSADGHFPWETFTPQPF